MKLVPDFVFSSVYDITPDFFIEQGITAIVSDIDNTLVTYDDEKPTEQLEKWLKALKENGITVAFVSNNSHERVRIFNEELGFFAVGKSGKPFKKNVISAIEAMKAEKKNACIIGDQIFTDVLAGRNAKIRTVLVPPIKDKTDVFTKFKRLLEKPLLKSYKKHNM